MKQKLKIEMTVIFDSDKYDDNFTDQYIPFDPKEMIKDEIDAALNMVTVEIKDFKIDEMEND